MATRVIRIQEPNWRAHAPGRRLPGPASTALMVAVSGTVLAASLLIASLSTAAVEGRTLTAGAHPEPAPPPTLATPMPWGAPMSP